MPKNIFEDERLYNVILSKEGALWGYYVDGFGGGAAVTRRDALSNAKEMVEELLAELYAEGKPLPQEQVPWEAKDVPTGGGVVSINCRVSNKAERIFVTIPSDLLTRIDAITNNRSAFFADLAKERLGG